MKRKFLQALCWAIIALLVVGVVTDALVWLGLKRAWQYIYNFVSFCAVVGLLVPALGEKLNGPSAK